MYASSIFGGNNNKLTEHMVFNKTRANSLSDVVNLNMWGYNLTDVSIIERMVNLEACSLSTNNITTLKQFSKCVNLKQLYLKQNNISDFRELDYLRNLKKLHTLWLDGNPITMHPDYRKKVFSILPNLRNLDENTVTHRDRSFSTSNKRYVDDLPRPNFTETFTVIRDPRPPPRVLKKMSSTLDNIPKRGILDSKADRRRFRDTFDRDETAVLTAVLALIPRLSDDSLQKVLNTIMERCRTWN